ncbi:MAG: hypothetical protein J7K46_07945, partial [Bacteroidales bacterium]|nr:hypothetical protein [Bacteroidales bacterium]
MKTKRKIIRIQGFRNFRFLVPVYLILLTVACTITRSTTYNETGRDNPFPDILFSAGVVTGGIVENAELSGIDNISDTDAISGATSLSFNAGIHTEISSRKHHMETGIDYVRFKQTVIFLIPDDAVNGIRDFRFQQLRLPLTYNFHFLKNSVNDPALILKVGLSVGYTLKT